MTPTIEKLTLSALDIKALRQADRVSFHHFQGNGSIICTRLIRNYGPYDDRERRYEFNVQSSFSGKMNDELIDPASVCCFEMIHTCHCSEEWQTVLHFLRAGDEITLHWSADGSANEYVRNSYIRDGHGAGEKLHADMLTLKVKRGDKRLAFLLDVCFCPDNTARMIRKR